MIDERFPNWEINIEKGTIYSLKNKRYIGYIDNNGYVKVCPPKGYKPCRLHQYIWMAANGCDIPNDYDVHHIDGNKLNNSIYNLELVEHKIHISEHKKGIVLSEETKKKMSESQINDPSKSKQVMQYTLNGELVKIWDSIKDTERSGFSQVGKCCKGIYKQHKGFIWKYI